MKDEEYILDARKSRKISLSRRYFKNNLPDILSEIYKHNREYDLDNDLFSQEVYNWIFKIKTNPKCPVTGESVRFDYHKFEYKKFKGRGIYTEEFIKKRNEKRTPPNYKKLYNERKEIPMKEISFSSLRELIKKEFGEIKNMGGFNVSFLKKYPEIYNYVNSDKFLPDCDKFQEKIYRIIHNMEEAPICCCDKVSKCNFKSFNKGYSKYGPNYRLARKGERREKLNSIVEFYDKNTTISKIKDFIKRLEEDGKSKQNLYQSFVSLDIKLVASIFYHTENYGDIKFSNKVFLLLNGEPNPDKKYIKPVFYSLEKGYDMRFGTKYGTSKPEIEMFEWLSIYIDDLKKVRVLDGKEIDMYSENHQIGVEFDGIYWHSYDVVGGNNMLYKKKIADSRNIQLLNIFETEWYNKKDIVKSLILSKFGIFEKRIYGRECRVEVIEPRICSEFLENNHLQGRDNSKYKFGLYHFDELMAVMTFGTRNITNKKEFELIRFCNKVNTQIVGGASKLFKYFIRNYNYDKIKTYANARISDGNFYEKLGFTFKHHSLPNYWYYYPESPKKLKLKHRSAFQKHKLNTILPNFDPDKTEWENMKEHGYNKIYDCGNLVFEYNH